MTALQVESDNTGEKAILVLAEDNPGDVFLIRRALDSERVNYELTVAKDGEEAIAFLAPAADSGRRLDVIGFSA